MTSLPYADIRAHSARERSPRLVLLFALCTALGVAAAAAVILVVVRHADTARAQGQAIDRAQYAARAVLGPELRAEDLAQRPRPERARQLDRLFDTRVLLEGIHGATLYGPNGRASYSTDQSVVTAATHDRVRTALSGRVVSEIATAEDGSRVLRTYVPVGVGSSGVGGVVALDQEYGRIEAAVRRSSWLIAGVLEGLLLLLFVIFVPLLARVSSRIRRHVDELEHVATHDELTGLPNRLGLRLAGEAIIAKGSSAVLLLADLDGFSEINDALGSESGDVLLREIAARLRHDLSDCAAVARLGEDKFGILLHDAVESDVEVVAGRVRESLARPFVVDDIPVAVTVRVGAALFPEHGPDFDTVLRRAGNALTMAKTEGQSSVQLFDFANETSDVSRLAFAVELREALDTGQLLMHYQPQMDLATRQLRCVEALVRWNHPQRGLLAADSFISYAERSGLATELRQFVLETSARQWAQWRDSGIELELAVNINAVDMLDVSLPDQIEDLIHRYEMPGWKLILEITERALVGDEWRARMVAERLGKIGVRLSVDDFGTGYSSLASLRCLPIRQVKLDRSLLAGVPGDEGAEAVIGGSVEIAHGLGATVVVEGVETRDQLRFVYLMGCDIAQGYLIGRPASARETESLLDAPRVVPLSAAMTLPARGPIGADDDGPAAYLSDIARTQ